MPSIRRTSWRRFELVGGKSEKFWRIRLKGDSYEVNFGRIGTDGQTKTKSFASKEKAREAYDKIVQQKVSKGYSEAGAKKKAASKARKKAPKKSAAKKPSSKKKSAKKKRRSAPSVDRIFEMIQQGQWEEALVPIREGKVPADGKCSWYEMPLLDLAVIRYEAPLVKELLELGADPLVRVRDGGNLIHLLAEEIHGGPFEEEGNQAAIEVVRFLVDAGVDINAFNDEGVAPIHAAVVSGWGNDRGVVACIECGADINLRSKEGMTAWMYNVRFLQSENFQTQKNMRKALLRAGADRTGEELFDFELAARNGDLPKVKDLCSQGIDPNGMPGITHPLGAAAGGGHLDVLRYLISEGADPNFGAEEVGSVLPGDNLEVVNYLLECGADPNLGKDDEWRPLAWAAYKGNLEVVKALIDAGAELEHRVGGETAIDQAFSYGHEEVAKYIHREVEKRKGTPPDEVTTEPVPSWIVGATGFDANGNFSCLVVHEEYEKVSEKLASMKKGLSVKHDVYGEEVPADIDGSVAYQLVSHDWTIVADLYPGYSATNFESSKMATKISKELGTEVLYFMYSDTGGVLQYEFYENGKLTEEVIDDCERTGEKGFVEVEEDFWVKAVSKRRKVDLKKLNSYQMAESLFEEMGTVAMGGFLARGDDPMRLRWVNVPKSAFVGMDLIHSGKF